MIQKVFSLRFLSIIVMIFALEGVSNAGQAGTYIVPKGARLAEDVTFTINRAKFRIDGQTARLQYHLPFELDGTTPHEFDLVGTFANGSWNMQSDDYKVFGVCTGGEAQFTCKMEYATNEEGLFPLDTSSANSYIATRTDLSREQIEKFQLAQVAFSHEPIGVVNGRKD